MQENSPNSIRVRLTGLNDLAPDSISGGDFRAWLTAPIVGEPLYKRILSVLLPLSIQELVLEPGPVSDAVLTLFEERPIYNLRARMAPSKQAASPEHTATLVVPVGGLLEADLLGLQRRGEQTHRIERTPVHLPGQTTRPKPEIIYLPPGRRQDEIDKDQPPSDPCSQVPPIMRPTDTSVYLRELALRTLEGDLASLVPAGEMRGGILCGPNATVTPGVRVVGNVAVGARSRTSTGCVLGPGAVIGEDCTLEANTHVIHSIVLDGCTVAEGERLLGVIRLPSGESL
jgi:hypothetical protein